jgi:hypothetical protein
MEFELSHYLKSISEALKHFAGKQKAKVRMGQYIRYRS